MIPTLKTPKQVKELKEIISKFNDNDLFYLEEGVLIFQCNDKSPAHGELMDIRDLLEFM